MLKLHARQWLSRPTVATALALGLTLGPISPSFATIVPGGGPKKTDCYVEFDVTGAASSSNKITCADGDPTCDGDGIENGVCAFQIAVCPNQTDPALTQCTPAAPLSAPPTVTSKPAGATLTMPTDLSSTSCADASDVNVALKTTKKGKKKPGKMTVKVSAAGSNGKKDKDSLKLICNPPSGTSTGTCNTFDCPSPNPNGGPDEACLLTGSSGTDLDNGWTGISHNFPVPQRSFLKLCLSGCDASSNPVCDATAPASNNGPNFGPPLPLIAQSVPVCVINRYNGTPSGKFNVQTGEVPADNPLAVNLFSDVHLTIPTQVCPRCAGGKNLGDKGTCDSGANQGKACTIESSIVVAQAEGNTNYALSRDCPPLPSQLAGTLDIKLRLTTDTATLSGSKPCTPANTGGVTGVAVQDDNCHGSPCNAGCTGIACVKMVTDPVTGQQVCQDSKGGISQFCCATSTVTPCFPTSATSGGTISRTGHPDPPAPVWPEPTYPKTSEKGVLVTTFCEGATNTSVINSTAGLPGPGALILPGSQTLLSHTATTP